MSYEETPTPEELLIERGVLPKHARKSLAVMESADQQWSDYLAQLVDFPKTHPEGGIAFVLGERGRGKTQMTVCAMRTLITSPDQFTNYATRRKWSVQYISAVDLFMGFRDAIKQGTELKTLRGFTDPRLLIIDDIHEQAGTDHESRSLTRLLDARLGHERYSVLITNNTRKSLPEAVGPSIAHRFQEAGLVIEVNGKNYRGQA